MKNKTKVTIFGAGNVGAAIANSLLHQKIVQEIAIIDINEKLLNSQVMDLADAAPVFGESTVKAGSYDDLKDSQICVIACGANQASGAQSRLGLVNTNARIVKQIAPKIFQANPKILLIMVTNPVDVLTQLAISLFPEHKNQIMGTGSLLDSLRLQRLLAAELGVPYGQVQAVMAGEHGNSSVALWSLTKVAGKNLSAYPQINGEVKNRLYTNVRDMATKIIAGKGATFYGISSATGYLIKLLLERKKAIMPLSHLVEGEYGLSDVCLGLPVVIDRTGVIGRPKLIICDEEKELLHKSAHILQEVFKQTLVA